MVFIYYFIHRPEKKCFASMLPLQNYIFLKACISAMSHAQTTRKQWLLVLHVRSISNLTVLYLFPQGTMAPDSFSLFFLSVYMKYQPKSLKKKRWWINWLCRGDIPRPFHMKSPPISVETCLCKSLFLEDWLALEITWWRKAQEYINKLSPKEHMTLLLSQESATQQKVGIQLQMAAFQIWQIKIFLKHLVGVVYYLTE